MLPTKKNLFTLSSVVLIVVLLAACAGTPAEPTQDASAIQTQAAQTVVADLTQNAPAATPLPQATATATELPPPPGPTPNPNIPVAVIPTAAPGEPSVIANYNTYIFSGPGEDYIVYSMFVGSSTAKVVGISEDGDWWAVSVPVAPEGSGWVDAEWVTVRNAEDVPVLPSPPVPPSTDPVPPGPDDPQGVVLANTFVRTGPGAAYPAYGVAEAGASGRIIGVSEDRLWWVVRLDPATVSTGFGWVQQEYIEAMNIEDIQVIETPPLPDRIPPPPPASGVPAVTAIEYVNVRTGPGTAYPSLGVAPPGAAAEVTGKSQDGSWWQVVIPEGYTEDNRGWVSASYVVPRNSQNVPVVPADPAPPGTIIPPDTGGARCILAAQSPEDETVFAPGSQFVTIWTVQNTGTTAWEQNQFDVRFGAARNNIRLHVGGDVYDLTTSVQPGWTYTFSVPMIAPDQAGQYGELWTITDGVNSPCQFFVTIVIE